MGRGALVGGWGACLEGDDGDDTISDMCALCVELDLP